MMKVIYLSHILERVIPVYGNERASLGIRPVKAIAAGDSCDTYAFSMENHWGTHAETSAHFFKGADAIADYKAGRLVFEHPCVVKAAAQEGSIIGLDMIKNKVGRRHDILLIKTGFGRFRGSKAYSFDNPAVSPEIGAWLRSERPNIRAVGFDLVSLGCREKRDLSRRSHRVFLDTRGKGKPILIIEDMDLSADLAGLSAVFAAPLLIKGIDSAPCTVFGVFNARRKR